MKALRRASSKFESKFKSNESVSFTERVDQFVADNHCKIEKITIERQPRGGQGSFGIGLAHYDRVCNVVASVRHPTSPLKVGDVIIMAGDIELITEQLENVLPAGDELTLTIVRPEDGQLPKLLANMTPRPNGQLLAPQPKGSRPSMSTGQIINKGVQLHVDEMLTSPLAKLEFSDRKEEEQEGLPSPVSPCSDSSASGQTRNTGAVARARACSRAGRTDAPAAAPANPATADETTTPTSVMDHPDLVDGYVEDMIDRASKVQGISPGERRGSIKI